MAGSAIGFTDGGAHALKGLSEQRRVYLVDSGEGTLTPMLRMRWAVQADYFAGRISTNDLTGIGGPNENEKGLEDARLGLTR